MHPSLDPKSLSNLPSNLRNCGTADLPGNPSAHNLRALYGHLPYRRCLGHFLPGYFAVFDPSIMSMLLARLDAALPNLDFFDTTLSQMFECLEALVWLHNRGFIPSAAAPDLWARLWPFIRFIDTYRDSLPDIEVLCDPKSVYELLFATISMLEEYEATAQLIPATPGFRILLFRMWTVFLLDPDPDAQEFVDFCTDMFRWPDISEDRDFDEAIEGAGGSLLSLASIFVRHIDCVVQHPRPSNALYSLLSILALSARSDVSPLRKFIPWNLGITRFWYGCVALLPLYNFCYTLPTFYLWASAKRCRTFMPCCSKGACQPAQPLKNCRPSHRRNTI
ncbi:hypothetical protein C8R44DRAFT_809103 [Mycena epipterygia]|nr:hypothetical protein C8R44DRAFT_809103 [Mycena epipterygia]